MIKHSLAKCSHLCQRRATVVPGSGPVSDHKELKSMHPKHISFVEKVLLRGKRAEVNSMLRVGLRRIPGSSVLSRTIEVKGKTAGIRKANEGATAEASRALIVITCTQAPACELSQASQMQV